MKTVERNKENAWEYYYPDLDITTEVLEESKGIYRYRILSDVSRKSFATIKSAQKAALATLQEKLGTFQWLVKNRLEELSS